MNTLFITVPDITEVRAAGYTLIRIYRDTSETGAFTTLNGTEALVAATESYVYTDVSGTLSHWYRTAFFGAVPGEGDMSPARKSDTSAAYATVEELRAHIGLTRTTDDVELALLLDASARSINRFCNRPDGLIADVNASVRYYNGQGKPYIFIDECVEITAVAVKDSASDQAYEGWASQAFPLIPSTSISLGFDSGSTAFTVGETLTGATSSATGIVASTTLEDGSWAGGDAEGVVSLTSVSGQFQEDEDLNGSTGGSAIAEVRQGDWIPFAGNQNFPVFNRVPFTGVMIDPNGDYSVFTGGKFTTRRGFRPMTTVSRGTPTVRVTARWGHSTTIPYDIKLANMMWSAKEYKRLRSSMADAMANPDIGQISFVRGMDPSVRQLLQGGRYVKPVL